MKRVCTLALFLAVGCSSARHGGQSPSASPAALGSCETRITSFDGVQAVVTSNVDGTLASVEIVHAPDTAARARAVDDAIHTFGPVHHDARVMTRPSKWGLSTLTDPCGRPVAPPSPKAGGTTR